LKVNVLLKKLVWAAKIGKLLTI